MKAYEGVFIFPPDASAEAGKEQFKKLDDLFTKFQANVLQKNDWGKKSLGYAIRKFHEAHFLIVDFQLESTKMPEFVKALELQEDILKYMITVKQEARPNPKAAKSESRSTVSVPAAAPVSKAPVS